MSAVNAKKFYLGLDGNIRMNCAQAVMSAFKESHNIADEEVERFRAYGGGRAPEGMCGAYYAAVSIMEDRVDDFKERFVAQAGSVRCKDIKESRKLSCAECVEHCATMVEEASKNRQG